MTCTLLIQKDIGVYFQRFGWQRNCSNLGRYSGRPRRGALEVEESVANGARYLACVVGLAFLVLALPVVSRADTVVYSDLASGNSYDPSNATTSPSDNWEVSGAASADGEELVAVPFTPSANYDLTKILIALSYSSGTNNGAYVTLDSDSSGTPGAVIESWTLSNLPALGSTSTITSQQTLTSAPGVLLTSGTTYWIVAMPDSAGTSDTIDGWNFNINGDSGTVAYSFDGTTWSTDGSPFILPALKVKGTPVPEPATFTMLGLALAALPFLRSRFGARRRE